MEGMKISIQKGTAVSIHQQLMTQIALQIASGTLAEGSKLPSVRGLSQRLDIHYNTCLAVYQELAELGMVEMRRGSGAYVSRFAREKAISHDMPQGLQQLARYFLGLAYQQGHTWEAIQAALAEANAARACRHTRFVFVDQHADILPLFQAELTEVLGCPVEAVTFDELPNAPNDEATAFLVSRYHHRRLMGCLDGVDRTVLLIDVGTGQEGVGPINALPEGAFVTVLSQSQTILHMAESMISSLRGHDLLVRCVLADEGPEEITRAVGHASLVIMDVLCAQAWANRADKPSAVLRLIPSQEGERIRGWLRANTAMQSASGLASPAPDPAGFSAEA